MFSPREEQLLREQIRDNTPMQVIGGPTTTTHPNQRAGHRQLDKELKNLPKLATTSVNGRDDVTPDGLARNYHLENRAKKFMLKGEQLGEFYSRTGLGVAQLVSMSDAEIRRHIELTARNNAEEGFKVPSRGGAEAGYVAPPVTVIDTHRIEPRLTYEQGDPGVAL